MSSSSKLKYHIKKSTWSVNSWSRTHTASQNNFIKPENTNNLIKHEQSKQQKENCRSLLETFRYWNVEKLRSCLWSRFKVRRVCMWTPWRIWSRLCSRPPWRRCPPPWPRGACRWEGSRGAQTPSADTPSPGGATPTSRLRLLDDQKNRSNNEDMRGKMRRLRPHLLLGELPVVVEVHLLEGLVRPGTVSDLHHLDDEGQGGLRRDLTWSHKTPPGRTWGQPEAFVTSELAQT